MAGRSRKRLSAGSTFAFVRFSSKNEAISAVRRADGRLMDGYRIRVFHNRALEINNKRSEPGKLVKKVWKPSLRDTRSFKDVLSVRNKEDGLSHGNVLENQAYRRVESDVVVHVSFSEDCSPNRVPNSHIGSTSIVVPKNEVRWREKCLVGKIKRMYNKDIIQTAFVAEGLDVRVNLWHELLVVIQFKGETERQAYWNRRNEWIRKWSYESLSQRSENGFLTDRNLHAVPNMENLSGVGNGLHEVPIRSIDGPVIMVEDQSNPNAVEGNLVFSDNKGTNLVNGRKSQSKSISLRKKKSVKRNSVRFQAEKDQFGGVLSSGVNFGKSLGEGNDVADTLAVADSLGVQFAASREKVLDQLEYLQSLGLGKKEKVKAVSRLIESNRASMVLLQESKTVVIPVSVERMIKSILDREIVVAPAEGFSGGLISLWDRNIFIANSHTVSRRFIMLEGLLVLHKVKIGIINVYGPNFYGERVSFFDQLNNIIDSLKLPVVVGGDFNIVRKNSERTGNHDNLASMLFENFISKWDLVDVPISDVRCVMGTGHRIDFWNDHWTDFQSLKAVFPRIYGITMKKFCSISEFGYSANGKWVWNIELRHGFFEWENVIWNNFCQVLKSGVSSNPGVDRLKWIGSPNGIYYPKDFCIKLATIGVWANVLWQTLSPVVQEFERSTQYIILGVS
ncbi:hypothetical protein F3Y22_tig00110387pilonHSYRG00356 [Hibiscus syriacus]|uniref:RRM domain-containing protein n=1 Tax=Hibiscus syriacus TaxID=106335 RepID=A0A6A3ASR9_HIBSY|nr:hypothetical protein F3Y22_tig00110387pilonHSYRG00356 [Hibiscus syriacus]